MCEHGFIGPCAQCDGQTPDSDGYDERDVRRIRRARMSWRLFVRYNRALPVFVAAAAALIVMLEVLR